MTPTPTLEDRPARRCVTIGLESFRVGPVEEPDPSRWETEVAYLVG